MQRCKQTLAKHVMDGAESTEGGKREDGGPEETSCERIHCLSPEGTFHVELFTPETTEKSSREYCNNP